MPPGFTEEQIAEAFTYHKPNTDQAERYGDLRAQMKWTAVRVLELTPAGPEQTLAIRKLEEASMWANKAIALEKPEAGDG